MHTNNIELEINTEYTKDDVFNEMEKHLLHDEKPSKYFNSIAELPIFQEYPFQLLYKLKEAEQSPKYHPEGNVMEPYNVSC